MGKWLGVNESVSGSSKVIGGQTFGKMVRGSTKVVGGLRKWCWSKFGKMIGGLRKGVGVKISGNGRRSTKG